MTTAYHLPGTDSAKRGYWRSGDPVGGRRFASVGSVDLECGGHLPEVTLAYETWGRPAPDRSNAILVLHGLTGDSHVAGQPGPGHPTSGWWQGLVGPGAALDTDRYFVVAPNALGGCQGSTGPSSAAPDGRPYGSRFPFLTIRDLVEVERRLTRHLGLDSWALVLGGSMGGMRAAEWAVTYPEQVRSLLLLACGAYATGDQIGWCAPQLAAIRSDPAFLGGDYYDAGDGCGPVAGLGVARRVAHMTYRSGEEIDERFGRRPQPGEVPLAGRGRYAVESYLDHQAVKLGRRFDPNSYLVLTEAMNTHDVGRGRGGIFDALSRITARTMVAAISSDRLYPPRLADEMAAAIPGCEPIRLIDSPNGHDGFLIEVEAVGALIRELLGAA